MTQWAPCEDLAEKGKQLLAEHPELRHDLSKLRLRVAEEACIESAIEPAGIPQAAFDEFYKWRSQDATS